MDNIYADKYVLRDVEQWNSLFVGLPQGCKINGLSTDNVNKGILVNQDSDNSYYIVTIGEEHHRIEKDFIEKYFIKSK